MAYVVNTARGAVVISDCCFKYQTSSSRSRPALPRASRVADAYARIRAAGEVVVPLYGPALLERFPGGRTA